MPRRKAPKRTTKVRRSSIKVTLDPSVTDKERKEKLEAFIVDFETQRDSRLRAIREDGENLVRKVNGLFQAELLKIPKSIREMKFVDFKDNYACDINTALLQSTQAELDKLKKPTTIRKPQRKGKKATTMFETIDEDCPQTVVRAGAVPESTMRTARMTRTAARVGGAAGGPVWADTPLVTPAFNPRLQRATKPRELERCTIFRGTEDSPQIEIPLNGRSLLVSKDTELDEESRKVLEDISSMINKVLLK